MARSYGTIYSRLFDTLRAFTFMRRHLRYTLIFPLNHFKIILTSMTRQPRDLGTEFEWYKHHSLDHAIDIIRKKGPTDNYEPGLGESLHPQVKTDYERSNHHPGLADMQMTRMAEERDSILRIRAKVDSFDEWEKSLDARLSVEPENPPDSRVSLCAPQRPVRVQDISSKLAPQEFGCLHFASRLVQLLDLYGGTKINVKRLQSCSIRRYHSIRINYVCMMSAAIKHDILRATPCWRKTGPRYDCATY